MSDQIELGSECFAYVNMVGDIQLVERGVDGFFTDVRFPPAQMDALCKWWQARSGKRAYSIKPPVWREEDGDCIMFCGPLFSGMVWRLGSGGWCGSVAANGICRDAEWGSVTGAKSWCEHQYREWVEQFLEST